MSTTPTRFLSLAFMPLMLGLFFFAASLTPSLVPRSWLLQGALGGLVAGIGYLVGQSLRMLWGAVGLPGFYDQRARRLQYLLAIPLLAFVAIALWSNAGWQNGIRTRLEMPPTDDTQTLMMLGLATLIFAMTILIGSLIQWLFNLSRRRLYRIVPERTANVMAVVIVVTVVMVGLNRGVVGPGFKFADTMFEAAQNLTEPESEAPSLSWQAGSAESLISWERMGKPGRDHVRLGPKAEDVTAFTGRPALDPIRVYVGRRQDDDPVVRAEIALQELHRVGAFNRAALVIASPTGTGWLDAGSHDPLEYLMDGDVATVAVQYSHLTSPLALIFETNAGLEQAEATVGTVYDYWKTLPESQRPKLYIHGLSLGAWSSMHAVNVFRMLNDPIDGALWAGSPYPSNLWNQANANRNPGSPYVLPVVGDGNLVRFASQFRGPDEAEGQWGDTRIVFLQYASDAIVFFEPGSTLRKPAWMQEPPAPDVSPDLTFTYFVTQFQNALDMAIATSVPMGYGHNYSADDYIDAWVEVLGVEDWSASDVARLKEHCGGPWGFGCNHATE